jgi:hypothetical protein
LTGLFSLFQSIDNISSPPDRKRKEWEELEREVTEPPKRELKKDSRMIPGKI